MKYIVPVSQPANRSIHISIQPEDWKQSADLEPTTYEVKFKHDSFTQRTNIVRMVADEATEYNQKSALRIIFTEGEMVVKTSEQPEKELGYTMILAENSEDTITLEASKDE